MSKPKPIIESIRDYINTFSGLKDNCLLLVDNLGADSIEYAVESVPCDPVYKRYTDGEVVKQFLFTFASREYYSADLNQCIENLHFYEQFEDWIEENNYNGILPNLDNKNPVSIEVLSRGYLYSADDNTAKYQLQLRLIYEED